MSIAYENNCAVLIIKTKVSDGIDKSEAGEDKYTEKKVNLFTLKRSSTTSLT
mgnify:CR=1 FL=1